MRAIIRRSDIDGTLRSPPSKSYTHRAIVCGLLSKGLTKLSNALICDDTLATLNASGMMGATIHQDDDLEIRGPVQLHAPSSEIDCGGSGTTLRVFAALASLTDGRCVLTGDKGLRTRPMADLLDGLRQLGVEAKSIHENGKPPLSIYGRGLRGGTVKIRGDVTSQYITGLLFACSNGTDDTRIDITTRLESRPYVEMTLEVMNLFGVQAYPSKSWNRIDVPGLQEYRSTDYTIEGDYSSAAFLLVAGALAGKMVVSDLRKDSIQGDAGVVRLLKSLGAPTVVSYDSVAISRSETQAFDIDASNSPDLVPILALLATQAKGVTTIRNAGRLRLKESDRIASISQELKRMGASIEESQDGLKIRGQTCLRGAVINPHDDHRIAMACIIAGLIANGTTVVENIECVRKSYPSFISDMQSIGAQISIERDNEGEV